MWRETKTYREYCSACETVVHAACKYCRRVYCRNHIASRDGSCFRCLDLCSSRSCDQPATKTCTRCARGLCVAHRTSGERRCGRCEGDYERNIATEVHRRTSVDGKDALKATLMVAALALITVVLGEYNPLFMPPGIAATYLLGGFLDAPLESVRSQQRRRFLAERSR